MHFQRRRPLMGPTCISLGGALAVAAIAAVAATPSESVVVTVASKDGTPISVECTGTGPTLLIVHGGTGDRTRWTPLFPLMATRLTVCAMDRRGHGTSGDSADYSLQKEVDDIVAVVNSRPGKVFVLGHSFGGVVAPGAQRDGHDSSTIRRDGAAILVRPMIRAGEVMARKVIGRVACGSQGGDPSPPSNARRAPAT